VLEVDLARKRISLTMKLDAQPAQRAGAGKGDNFRPAGRGERARGSAPQPAQGAMAAAFAKLQGRR
jgi:uncharacterized protein